MNAAIAASRPSGLADRPAEVPTGAVVFGRIRWDPKDMRYHFTYRPRGGKVIHFQTTVQAAGGSWQNAERICQLCYASFETGMSKEEVLSYRNELYQQSVHEGHRRRPDSHLLCPSGLISA